MIKTRRCVTRVICLVLLTLLMLSPLFSFIEVNAEATSPVLTDDMKLMGYGYNVTAGVPLEGATSLNLASPILDMSDPELLAAINTFEIGSHTKANSTSSSSAREMATAVGSVIGGGLNIGISMVSADINFMFQRNTYSEKTVQEYYEYYYEEIIRRAIIIQMPVSEIKEHLSDAFLRDLRAVDSPLEAQELIQKYGTHLMTGYNLGGRLSFTNYRQSTSASEELQTNIDLKAKIGASVKTIEGGVDFSFGEQFTNREFTETATSEYGFQSIGGEAITALTIDHVFQYNPSALDGKGGFVYNGWVQSVNEGTRLAILGLANGATAIPIWDLIPNDGTCEIARKYVMDAYLDVCGDKYSEYCEKYPYLKSNYDGTAGASTGSTAELKGYYYSSNGNYYYVDQAGVEAHNKAINAGATLFLDVLHSVSADKISYKVTKGNEYATVLDTKNGIVKIGGNAPDNQEIIVVIYDGEVERESIKFVVKTKYSGGMGTKEYPYLISSYEDISSLSKNGDDWAKYFRLTHNLDFQNNNGTVKTIKGIGSKANNFRGVFDGNYCSISGFKITDVVDGAIGLFYYSNGTIKNLTIGAEGTNTTIQTLNNAGANYAGALLGCMNGGTVENCKVGWITVETRYTNGTPSDYTASAGALIGVTYGGIVTECASISATVVSYVKHSDGADKANVLAGGLIGLIENGTVSHCWVHPPKRIQAQAESASVARAYQGMLAGKISKGSKVSYCVTGIYSIDGENKKPIAIATNGTPEKYFGAFIGFMDGTDSSFDNCVCQIDKTNVSKDIYITQGTEANKIDKLENSVKWNNLNDSFKEKWQANSGADQFPVLKRHVDGYVTLKIENGDISAYTGSYWNPLKIVVKREENGANATVVSFRTDDAPTNKELDGAGVGTYNIKASNCTYQKKLNIMNKEIVAIYVQNNNIDDGTEFLGTVYVDETFAPETHATDIEIWGMLSNGESLLLAKGDKLVDRNPNVNYPSMELEYVLETQNIGKNKVIVALNKNLVCQYTVNCQEREVKEVIVELVKPEDFNSDDPEAKYVPEYKVGSVFDSKTIEKIWVKYEGINEPVEVKVSDVEFIGDTIYYGESQVHLAYKDYTSVAIDVKGVCDETTHIGGVTDCQTKAVCERCGVEYEAYGAHDYVKTVVLPTCTDAGYDEYKCTVCGDHYEDNFVSAVGHEGGTATCKKPAQCIHCKEEYGAIGSHVYTETVVAPTCEKDGYTVHTCTACDDTYRSDVVLATGHKGGMATCIARAICTICEATYGGYATHDYSSLVTPPTCTKAGYTEYKCAACGDSYKDNYVSALGHSGGTADCENQAECEVCGSPYGEVGSHKYTAVKTEATCVKDGSIKRTCSICGDVETEVLNAPGHTGGTATCKAKAKCTRCGAEYGNVIDHTYTTKTVMPTCVNDGYVLHTCTVCDDSYTSDGISAKGHTGGTATCKTQAICTVCSEKYGSIGEHTYVTSVTSATCTAAGYTTHTCATCGENYKDNYVSALGHMGGKATCTEAAVCERCSSGYGELGDHVYASTIIRPTCETEGYTQYSCSACGNESYIADVVPAVGHIGGKATCNTLAVCTVCKESYGEYAGHKYTSAVVAPTCTEMGYTEYTCSVCEKGYKDNYVDALGHMGGKATCTEAAVCERCSSGYGELGDHVYASTIIRPTCETEGYTQYNCSACGNESYIADVVPAVGHIGGKATCNTLAVCTVCKESYGEYAGHKYTTAFKAPTCTHAGYTEYTCTVCEQGYKDNYVSSLGHSGGVANQNSIAVCEKCGEEYTVQSSGGNSGNSGNTPSVEHNYAATVIAPTCTNAGYTEYKCVTCPNTYKDNYVSALGHNYIDEVTPPTATEQGYTLKTCSVCGDSVKTDCVEALGNNSDNGTDGAENNGAAVTVCEHSGGAATCEKAAVCDECGEEYGPLAEHAYPESGCNQDKCVVCGHKKPAGNTTTSDALIPIILNALIVPLAFIFKRRFF